jgi:hypothetical protein
MVGYADRSARALFACALHHAHRIKLAMVDAQIALNEQTAPTSPQDESGVVPTRPHNTICKLWAKATQIRGTDSTTQHSTAQHSHFASVYRWGLLPLTSRPFLIRCRGDAARSERWESF